MINRNKNNRFIQLVIIFSILLGVPIFKGIIAEKSKIQKPDQSIVTIDNQGNLYSKESIKTLDFNKIKNRDLLSGKINLTYSDSPHIVNRVHVKLNEELVCNSMGSFMNIQIDTTKYLNALMPLQITTFNDKGKVIKQHIKYVYISNDTDAVKEAARKNTAFNEGSSTSNTQIPQIPVLMYHNVVDTIEIGDESNCDESNSVTTEQFSSHLERIKEEDYTTISFKDLNDFLIGNKKLPKKPIIITADDGYLNNYTNMYPLLKKFDSMATFFVSTNYVGDMSQRSDNNHFTWNQAKEMEASGLIDIQSHTANHVNMKKLSPIEVEYEVSISFAEIEKNLGKREVKVLAYPEFKHSHKSQELVKSLGINFQITDLVESPSNYKPVDIKRIHVHSEMTTSDLLKAISNKK